MWNVEALSKLGEEWRNRKLADVFNAFSNNDIGEVKRQIIELISENWGDSAIVEPVMASLDRLALQRSTKYAADFAAELTELADSKESKALVGFTNFHLRSQLDSKTKDLKSRVAKQSSGEDAPESMRPADFVTGIGHIPVPFKRWSLF